MRETHSILLCSMELSPVLTSIFEKAQQFVKIKMPGFIHVGVGVRMSNIPTDDICYC